MYFGLLIDSLLINTNLRYTKIWTEFVPDLEIIFMYSSIYIVLAL